MQTSVNRHGERMPERYGPWVGHINDHTVLMSDRSRMAMVRLIGAPFELQGPTIRTNRAKTNNELFRRLPVDQFCIHLVKHDVRVPKVLRYDTEYGTNLMGRYNAVALGSGIRQISWFISLIVKPSDSGSLFGSFRKAAPNAARDSDRDMTDRLEQAISLVMGSLSENEPHLCGRREIETDMPGHTVTMSEIGSALRLIRTGIESDVPETAGPLWSGVLDTSPLFGKSSFDLNIPEEERFGAMVSLKDYPGRTRPGMFNPLLAADFCFSLTHAVSYEGQRKNAARMELAHNQTAAMGSRATDLVAGIVKMNNDQSMNRSRNGVHNAALAAFSRDPLTLNKNVGFVVSSLTKLGGATTIRETNRARSGGMEAQYWSLLPGVTWLQSRAGQVASNHLANMASLEGFPVGQQSGEWGSAPIRFRTRAGTPFDYIPTVEDVAHTMLTGGTGGGKTVLTSLLKTAMVPVLGSDGLRLLIDKDQSNRISIEMEGGSYATFKRNEASGTAPLKFFEDTPRNRDFFHRLYSGLITRDGRGELTNDEDRRLVRGIARQMAMPKHLRSMGGVRELLGYADRKNGAGARFEKWCRGGSMGWLLDGDRHIIDLNPERTRLYGFDFTALIPKENETDDGSCQAVASVITHQLSEYIDGRRIMCVFEEARFYLQPLGRMIEDYALTGRKNELMMVLVAQQPEHFLHSPIGLSLISQCKTKIMFPNKDADRESYVDKMHLTPQAFEQLSSGMFVGEKARRFLLWRGPDDCAICEFDLSGMRDELAIMSARAGSNKALDSVMDGGSDTRDAFLKENARRTALRRVA